MQCFGDRYSAVTCQGFPTTAVWSGAWSEASSRTQGPLAGTPTASVAGRAASPNLGVMPAERLVLSRHQLRRARLLARNQCS